MRPLHILSTLAISCLAHDDLQAPLTDESPASNSHITPELYAELEELSRIVDISYCVGTANTGISKPFNCLSRCAGFPSFELITTWNTGALFTDSCGYVALSHEPAVPRIIVAFRGTYSIANTVMDLATMPQEYLPYPGSNDSRADVPKCNNCTVHLGFYKSWSASQEIVIPQLETLRAAYPDYELTLVGHSLGGAVASLAGLEFLNRGWRPAVTTFGSPKIGNKALAKYFDMRFDLGDRDMAKLESPDDSTRRTVYRRVTHRDDPVPLLPPSHWGYAPHAGELFIDKSSLPFNHTDVLVCHGDKDKKCIAGQDDSNSGNWIPVKYRLWQLLFAHRDYFWRLGVCLPEMRFGWWGSGRAADMVNV